MSRTFQSGETQSSINNCWTDSFVVTALRLWNKKNPKQKTTTTKKITCSSCCTWMLITPDYEVLLTFVDSEITWPRFYISFCSFQKSRFKKQISGCDTLMSYNLRKRMSHSTAFSIAFFGRKFYCAIPLFILYPCAESVWRWSFVYSRMVRLSLKWKSECISISPPPVYFVYRDVMVYSNIAFYLLTLTKNISARLRKSGQFACLYFWK